MHEMQIQYDARNNTNTIMNLQKLFYQITPKLFYLLLFTKQLEN
jgi:hypothetical protein